MFSGTDIFRVCRWKGKFLYHLELFCTECTHKGRFSGTRGLWRFRAEVLAFKEGYTLWETQARQLLADKWSEIDLGQWEYRREEKEYITTPKSANDLFQG